MPSWLRGRDERGLVLPTRLMVASISMVALSGLGFVATQSGDDSPRSASPAASHPRSTPKAKPTHGNPTDAPPWTSPIQAPQQTQAKPVVHRGKVYVVVFNNSNVKGLAGKTGTRAQRAGWNVVGTDNWYGTVDASTVYYPARLKAAATLLAHDLGITRVRPSIAPMRTDRVTVILTGDYAG